MNEYNQIDCCFDCSKQFNSNLCIDSCKTRDNCDMGWCSPGGCKEFERKVSLNNKNKGEDNMNKRDLNISDEHGAKANISDLQVYGDTDTFALLCKASSDSQGFSKATKVCNLPNGCLVQVSTLQRNFDGSYSVAEALTFVPDVNIDKSVEPRVFKLIERGEN